jgi:hypothetical protein
MNDRSQPATPGRVSWDDESSTASHISRARSPFGVEG